MHRLELYRIPCVLKIKPIAVAGFSLRTSPGASPERISLSYYSRISSLIPFLYLSQRMEMSNSA